jgi:aminoglycoside 3-N-acetyltransferase
VSEQDAIGRAARPATVTTLAYELRELGLGTGDTVMVHSSLSRLGYVAGGAHAVVLALLDVVGAVGTVMMPTHSGDLSDPASWTDPPVPTEWCTTVRDEMPPYDLVLTPTRGMGAIAECFRRVPGAQRSAHPTVSATAVGPNAPALIDGPALACGLGESSPQAKLYALDGLILLLGVTHANNTSLHLAEYRAAPHDAAMTTYGSPVVIDGLRTWVTYPNLVDDDGDFERLGDDFARTGAERTGPVGAGTARLMRARDIVDFATSWMRTNRTWPRRTD